MCVCNNVTCVGGDEKTIVFVFGGVVLRTLALVSVSEHLVRRMIFDKCILVTLV